MKKLYFIISVLSCIAMTSSAQVVAGEYFFDTDPGAGNGTAISFAAGQNVSSSFSVSTSSLAPGFHNLFFRVKNNLGKWSHYEGRMFYILESPVSNGNETVVSGEWFIDTDPGIGNGTPVSFAADSNINPVVNINTGNLSLGTHLFYLRVKQNDGTWSHYEGRTFEVSDIEIMWYLDADGDGWYSETQSSVGSPGEGWTSTPPSGGQGDCDDNDATAWVSDSLYIDTDGDGYTNGSEVVCYGETAPEGYSFVSEGEDCNDNNATEWTSDLLYIDTDGDGYTNGSEVVCYGETAPEGYSFTSEGEDCDDADQSLWTQPAEITIALSAEEACLDDVPFAIGTAQPEGGVWTGAGISNGIFSPQQAGVGTHTISYSVDGDGQCILPATASEEITVTVCISVSENVSEQISVFPTHTSSTIYIRGENLQSATLIDMQGRLIETVSLLGNPVVLDISRYSHGIYLLRINTSSAQQIFKIVKE